MLPRSASGWLYQCRVRPSIFSADSMYSALIFSLWFLTIYSSFSSHFLPYEGKFIFSKLKLCCGYHRCQSHLLQMLDSSQRLDPRPRDSSHELDAWLHPCHNASMVLFSYTQILLRRHLSPFSHFLLVNPSCKCLPFRAHHIVGQESKSPSIIIYVFLIFEVNNHV